MKKVTLISVVFSLLVFASFDMRPFLTVQLNAAEETLSVSDCSCKLKEALKEGDWQKAKESAEDIITKAPASPEAQDAYLWLGLYHKSQYDFSKSTEVYQKAEELFPNTWASAEATARIGCNYYKMNNFSKALEYYRKAASEAKTWQQRKYTSAWAKWVHFALAGQEQQLVANCATKSINYYLSLKRIKLDKRRLASSLTLKDGLVPLSEILKFLKKENVKLKAVKCSLDRIKDLQLPVVAVVKPSHLIVIKDFGKGADNKIKVYDPVLGEIYYYKKELADIWAGKVLTISSPSFWKFASLSKKELDNVFLGACYCCPDIVSDCDGDGDECCPGGGGGSGPGGDGPCGGWGCYAAGAGFPRITVDKSTLALIIRDTPIAYKTAIGEEVKVTFTFNSDLTHIGIFGNSWHSNLETQIIENPDDSVTVARSGGHNDPFTYLGGQYNPPPGVSNKLVKNPDGTFTLEFVKSHRKYHYDTHSNGGKLLSIEDRNGNTVTFQYDQDNHLTSITDASGRATNIQTDASGRITQITDPLGRQATFAYDANGDLTQVQDMAGNTFSYHYDLNHNITSITEPMGVYTIQYGQSEGEIWVSSITDPEDNTYQYGGEWPTYVMDPRENYTYYYADWGYGWPYYGDIAQISDALGNSVYYTYDDNRNRTEIMDKRGNITHYTYDSSRNLTSKTDPLENSWTYTYDTGNNLISATDPRGKITAYTYDSFNNLLSVTEKAPDQTILSTVSYTYDSRGLTTSMTANGNTTTYDYDTNGNLIQTTSPEGNITTFAYDAIGRKISMTNANGITQYEYDNLDRITKITHPDSTYIQYTYNCCNLSQKRDENGKITNYEYDSLGKLTKVTDALENQTIYTYDGVGNLISLKDAKNNTTTYTYDVLNRLARITYPSGDSESYTYDPEGNMLTKQDGKGLTIYYTYDENNRLIQIKNTSY